MKPAQFAAMAAGALLMGAPDLWDYRGTLAADIHHTIGPLLMTFGIVALWAATRDVRWANLPLAAVLLASPLFTAHSAAAAAVAIGGSCALIGAMPFGGPDPQRRGNGWHGLLRRGRTSADS